MSWKMSVDHETKYSYLKPIYSQHNELRISPRDTPQQFTLEHNLEIDPATNLYRYNDYFGTRVTVFAIEEEHQELSVKGHSLVETASGAPHVAKAPVTWEMLKSDSVNDKFCEYLSLSEYTKYSPLYEPLIEELRGLQTPGLAVDYLGQWIRNNIFYQPGSTHVKTTAPDIMENRMGVCQDFVHLGLAVLRQVGIPCRYVSGYLYPADHGEIGEVVSGESHAWMQAWLGDWYGVDPTNDTPVAEKHVLVGWGRDYDDIAPVKGVINGVPNSRMTVTVSLCRVA
jgi:transglutaminase-like putative cysteine protease